MEWRAILAIAAVRADARIERTGAGAHERASDI